MFGIPAEDDVCATAGHVRRDRHCPLTTGLRDDLGFLLVVLGVEDAVIDTEPAEFIAD